MKTKRLFAWLLTLVLLMGMAPIALAEDYDDDIYVMYVKANTTKVKMYSEMSTKSSVLTKVPVGKKVTCYNLTIRAKWVSVSYNGYYGYMQTKFLSDSKPVKPTPKPEPKPTRKPEPKPTAKPTAKPIAYEEFTKADYYAQVRLASSDARINMRWQPSTEADVVGVYPNGSCFRVLMQSKSWLQVMDETENRVGYMARKYLVEVEEPVVGVEQELETDSELTVSPMNSVESLDALQAALPGVYLPVLPEDSENVDYDWISGEPVIAQMLFEQDGMMYCLRAAQCESQEDAVDIDGIYTPMHEEAGEADIHMVLDDEHTIAVAHYFSAAHQTQYSLCGSAEDDGAATLALAKAIFPAE